MPVAGAHEPDELIDVLGPWLSARVDADVTVSAVEVPGSNGFSNETVLFRADWQVGGSASGGEFVLRTQSPEHKLFPIVDLLAQQCTTMTILGESTDVPVPAVRWSEAESSVLGAPFFVMERLHGDVPGDNPPYLRDSFVTRMDESTRRAWSENALDILPMVAKVPWRDLDFGHLDLSQFGALGPEQRHGYLGHFRDWVLDSEPHPVIDPAWARLEATWPDDGDHLELCWGDARPGNQMFNGPDVVGVFDWEMVSIGNAESDLGWWLLLQRFSSESMGVDLPSGVLDRAASIARWEQAMGRSAPNVEFYELVAGYQFCLIFVMLSRAIGLGMEVDNPVATLTSQLLNER